MNQRREEGVDPRGLATGFVWLLMSFLLTASANAQEDEANLIRWRDHTVNTGVPTQPAIAAFALGKGPEIAEAYYFVQFTDSITREMKAEVTQNGGELVTYVSNNAYVARMEADAKEKVEALRVVRWVGGYQPVHRMSRSLLERLTFAEPLRPPQGSVLKFERGADAQPQVGGSLYLTVLGFPGESVEVLQGAVKETGAEILAASTHEDGAKIQVRVAPEDSVLLANINGVMWIEELRSPRAHNDSANGLLRLAAVWNHLDLKGQGQVVAIADTGFDTADGGVHPDIGQRLTSIVSWPVQPTPICVSEFDCRNPANSGDDDGGRDLDSGHGTHVSGSVAGDGTVSGGRYAGVAPRVDVFFQAIEQFTNLNSPNVDGYYLSGLPDDLGKLFQQAFDAGARIHSNSWGANTEGAYTSSSQEVDRFVWNHPDFLVVFAAGNAGADADKDNRVDCCSIGSPGTAKNALTVGAMENGRPDVSETYSSAFGPIIDADRVANSASGIAAFASRGPTADGRIKPELVAPGTMVASLRSQASPNRTWFSDSMEGGANGWTADGTWDLLTAGPNTSWHDSPAGDYAENSNSSLTSDELDLSQGEQGSKTLQFRARYELASGDRWFVEVSDNDGGSWARVPAFNGTQEEWELVSIDLGPYGHSSRVRLRFRVVSDEDGNTGDGLYIDDVRISEGAFGHSLLSDQDLASPGSTMDDHYVLMSGTSMATPLAAGAAALVREHFVRNLHLPNPSAALLKATLTNGASEMAPGQYGEGSAKEIDPKPNNAEGWGRLDVAAAILPSPPQILDYVDETAGLETGDQRLFILKVTSKAIPIRVTLVYHDYPGPSIVNDLDLRVVTPGGQTLFPNGRQDGPDRINNVEHIALPAQEVATGEYRIVVTAQNVPNGPQPFALVSLAGGEMNP